MQRRLAAMGRMEQPIQAVVARVSSPEGLGPCLVGQVTGVSDGGFRARFSPVEARRISAGRLWRVEVQPTGAAAPLDLIAEASRSQRVCGVGLVEVEFGLCGGDEPRLSADRLTRLRVWVGTSAVDAVAAIQEV